MRSVLMDWLHEVHVQFRLLSETFYMAVSIVDRYLMSVKNTLRKELQLVGITGLFIASKYEELYSPDCADFSFITDNAYNKRQIMDMEKKMIKVSIF